MDLPSTRLGFAYASLKQALGEDLAPSSFAGNSMVFVDRSTGAAFFCSAARDALWVGLADENGALGTGQDQASLALRARAEPAYLRLSSSFERDATAALAAADRAAKAAAPPSAPVGEPRFSKAPRRAQ
jgi:hypothetical protein